MGFNAVQCARHGMQRRLLVAERHPWCCGYRVRWATNCAGQEVRYRWKRLLGEDLGLLDGHLELLMYC